MRIFFARFLMLTALALLIVSCSEPPFRIHQKLETMLQGDLKYIVGEVEKGSGKEHLLRTPYFVIRDIRFFEGDTARIYSAYAEVDYYYYKDIAMYQVRKYRYNTSYRSWDRYLKNTRFLDHPAPEPNVGTVERALSQDSSNSANFPKKAEP